MKYGNGGWKGVLRGSLERICRLDGGGGRATDSMRFFSFLSFFLSRSSTVTLRSYLFFFLLHFTLSSTSTVLVLWF